MALNSCKDVVRALFRLYGVDFKFAASPKQGSDPIRTRIVDQLAAILFSTA